MLTIRDSQLACFEDAASADFARRLDAALAPPLDAGSVMKDAAAYRVESEAGVARLAATLAAQGVRSVDDLPKPAKNALLAHGETAAARLDQLERSLGAPAGAPAPGFAERPVGAAVEPCPLQQAAEKPVHWIEIELIGDDDSPIPWEEYCITLPDGAAVRGYLDAHGFARVQNIAAPGECAVTFPRLDRAAWDWASAPRSASGAASAS